MAGRAGLRRAGSDSRAIDDHFGDWYIDDRDKRQPEYNPALQKIAPRVRIDPQPLACKNDAVPWSADSWPLAPRDVVATCRIPP
jgi:hypothetical protein